MLPVLWTVFAFAWIRDYGEPHRAGLASLSLDRPKLANSCGAGWRLRVIGFGGKLRRRSAAALRARHLWVALGGGLAMSLASCSYGDAGNERRRDAAGEAAARERSKSYPPGAAAALSILGATGSPSADPFTGAVNCAVAIQVTSELAAGVAALGSAEGDMLRQAETVFRRRAADAASEVGRTAAEVPAAIEQRALQVQDSPATQAQLAMACLRELSGTDGSSR